MKKSHDHTHLTRLAAISLVLVMCLSALPMIAPSASAAEGTTYTWTAASDGHYGSIANPNGERQDALIDRIVADGAQRHFDVGDMSQTGASADYVPIKAKYDAMGLPYHVVVGNHDASTTTMISIFKTSIPYTVVDGDYVWIVLNAAVMYHEISSIQITFLEAALEAYRDKVCFVLCHVPQKRIQPELEDTDVDNEAFIDLVEAHANHIGAVIFGHVHTPTIQTINGVHYVNAGTYGSSHVNTLDTYGYMRFEVTSSGRSHTISVNYVNITSGQTVSGLSSTYTVTTPSASTYVWDGEGEAELASNPVNWRLIKDGVVTNDAPLVGDATMSWGPISNKNCTWDLPSTFRPYGWVVGSQYTNKITISGDIDIGKGGFVQFAGRVGWLKANLAYCAGPALQFGGAETYGTLNLVMTGVDAKAQFPGSVNLLDVRASVTITKDTDINSFVIADGARLTINDGIEVRWASYATGASFNNFGTIDGSGRFQFRLYDTNAKARPGVVLAKTTITGGVDTHRVLTMTGDATFDSLSIVSGSPTNTLALDLANHNMTAASLIIGTRGAMLGGNGTITVASWDSTAGTWTPQSSTVRILDGGSIQLAADQSFNALYIASDDGRTATWDMTATGAQAPIVTGLKSGSYLWYLDGVEQGEIVADKDGTIALSYESTGLHTLEVKPTQMTIAMDGMAAAVGIVAVLAVLGGLITMVGRIKI